MIVASIPLLPVIRFYTYAGWAGVDRVLDDAIEV